VSLAAIVMYVKHVQRSEEFKQPSRDEFSEWRCHAVAREQHVQREDLNSLYIFSPINVRIKLAVRLAPRIKQKNPSGCIRALCLFGMYTMMNINRERWVYLMYDRENICTGTHRIKTKSRRLHKCTML